MKFTKQEQSLIKLAAAHMAPQMIKKATLQDKLAEYGIGMSKKAVDADGSWVAPALPSAGIAQAAKPSGVWATQFPSGKQKLINSVRNYLRNAGKPAQEGALPGYAVGSAMSTLLSRAGAYNRRDAARGAINEIKTNGWPNVGMGPYFPAQIRAKGYPVYGNRLFQDFANLAKNPEDLNVSIGKMNREGVAPDTRRSDHTGLSSTFRANPRILAPQQ